MNVPETEKYIKKIAQTLTLTFKHCKSLPVHIHYLYSLCVHVLLLIVLPSPAHELNPLNCLCVFVLTRRCTPPCGTLYMYSYVSME